MTIVKHELKQELKSFWIWTLSIGALIALCVVLFPEFKNEAQETSDMFASMGSFSSAFGMDRLNFGTLSGFYAIECGNVLGIGGAFYAALIGAGALAKEEKEKTAEFLLTHPISRVRVITEKLIAIAIQIFALNVISFLLSIASVVAIGEEIPWADFGLMHLAFLIMQFEIAGICFGISAFIKRGGLGIGIGIASLMYCFNIAANITSDMKFLKYITAFGYTDGADILTDGKLDAALISCGMVLMVAGVIIAYVKYSRKDIS